MKENLKLLKSVSIGNCSESDLKKLYGVRKVALMNGASNFRSDMALRAAKFGYFKWPIKIREYVRGKRVLDVGCGAGTDSIGFITLGAREYVGIDPGMKLDNDTVKNKNGERLRGGLTPKESFGWTPRDISLAFSNISFFRGTFEQLRAQKDFVKFDLIVMHTVTEHLMRIEEVFAGCASVLADNGTLIYFHHNFYCWNGHHMAPKRIQDIDSGDPEQRKYMDWNHILFDPPEGHYFGRGLNRIRLDDLSRLTEKYFIIQKWEERRDGEEHLARLTEEIRDRLSEYSLRELMTNKVFCIASAR